MVLPRRARAMKVGRLRAGSKSSSHSRCRSSGERGRYGAGRRPACANAFHFISTRVVRRRSSAMPKPLRPKPCSMPFSGNEPKFWPMRYLKNFRYFTVNPASADVRSRNRLKRAHPDPHHLQRHKRPRPRKGQKVGFGHISSAFPRCADFLSFASGADRRQICVGKATAHGVTVGARRHCFCLDCNLLLIG